MKSSDLAIIAKQEDRLQFNAFDHTTAWMLGEYIKKHLESQRLAVLIEIRLCRDTVFLYAMPRTSPNNADWARRKRNTCELQQRSSYAVGLHWMKGRDIEGAVRLALARLCAPWRYRSDKGQRCWRGWHRNYFGLATAR